MGKSRRRERPGNKPPDGALHPLAMTAARRWIVAAGLAALALGAAVMFYKLRVDPRVFYLSGAEQGAQWIRNDEPMLLGIFSRRDWATVFATSFAPKTPVSNPRLTVRAFRRFEVQLDGATIFQSPEDLNSWKQSYDVPLGESVAPGLHQLRIVVFNRDAHPCLMTSCPELGLRSGGNWLANRIGHEPRRSLLATQVVAPDVTRYYPTVAECFRPLAGWLAAIFALSLGVIWWAQRAAGQGWTRWLTPAALRWCLLLAWVVLGANNIARIDPKVGYDLQGHVDYVKFVAQKQALPLATDGWQMFQAPLFYLLAAPWYSVACQLWSDEIALKALRVLPLMCGLAQIELVYRVARAVFPTTAALQMIATLVGGFMPMNVYISQVVGNEPLASCLTSLVVLLCVWLLVDTAHARGTWYFVGLGAVWGLALLAKVTPLVMAPLVLAAVVVYTRTRGDRWPAAAVRLAAVGCSALCVAAWYFIRNLAYLGTPFTSGWGETSANAWWQDPGYRTWDQLTSLGLGLTRPVYSGCWSLWDALYSTMWLDGFTSGQVDVPDRLPWNATWMMSGAWLGLLPATLIVSGFIAAGQALWRAQRGTLWFAAAAVLVYLAAIVDRFLTLPAVCAAKSSYLLGVLPCLAVLAAAGAAPVMRHRAAGMVLGAGLICWAVATYAAYFSIATP